MGIGVSIFLLAVGAILAFAVHATVSGVSIQTIGVILMVVGVLGLLMTMLIWGPRRPRLGRVARLPTADGCVRRFRG